MSPAALLTRKRIMKAMTEIFLRCIQTRPERPDNPNSRQRSGLRRSHVALLRRAIHRKIPAIPPIPLNSTYAVPRNQTFRFSLLPCIPRTPWFQNSAQMLTFSTQVPATINSAHLTRHSNIYVASPCIHDFHAKKILRAQNSNEFTLANPSKMLTSHSQIPSTTNSDRFVTATLMQL